MSEMEIRAYNNKGWAQVFSSHISGLLLIEGHMGPSYRGQAMAGPCHAKTELLLAYQKAGVRYSKAVNKLSRYVGIIPEVRYMRLRLMVQRVRNVCRAAKRALSVHVAEHDC